MTSYAALDVSQETTAICVVDENGRIVAEKIVATCPDTIATWLLKHTHKLARVGLETGPLAVWLWNELREHDLPVICLDARHAHAALKMRSNKTDRNDAAGLAQIIRTGWFKQVQIKSRDSYEIRSLLSGREVLVRIRVTRFVGCCAPLVSSLARLLAGLRVAPRRLWRATWMPLPPCSS